MTEALYRKYRPSTFRDIVGQEHIERTLKNAIEQDKVSHAYLFCGPRGTGKTTTARILAKALLCEKGPTTDPDGTCEECLAIANGNHPDVYELDAASRTGVENVREEIISRVNYAPTRGQHKVYIIDEVHMLSTAAFNALLKTLEEPPSHVIFILCTTDPQKVPETIHSRCQRFDFHRISVETIVSRLGAVCVQEQVEFEPEALELVAYRSDGGMRNALTSLEQLIAFGEGKVTLSGAQNLLGSLDDSGLSEIVQSIGQRDAAACFMWVSRYVETGADLAQFVLDLAEHLRNLYLLRVTKGEVELPVPDSSREMMKKEIPLYSADRLSRLLGILDEVIKELRVSSNPRLSFEIALTRMVRPESDLTLEALVERIEALEQRLSGAINPANNFAIPIANKAMQTQQSLQQNMYAVQQNANSVSTPASFVSSNVRASGSANPAAEQPIFTQANQHSAIQAASEQTRQQTVQNEDYSVSVQGNSIQPQTERTVSNRSSGHQNQSVSERMRNSQTQPEQAQYTPQSQKDRVSAVVGSVAVRPMESSTQVQPSASSKESVRNQSSAAVQNQNQNAQPNAPVQQPVSLVATPQNAVSSVAGSNGAGPVDLSNPAKVQRMWHSVVTQLRKTNPARGVLFMNAQISSTEQNEFLIEFSAESGFAYNAAQKPEVQELLSQTIQSVLGAAIPFRLKIAGQQASPAVGGAAFSAALSGSGKLGDSHMQSGTREALSDKSITGGVTRNSDASVLVSASGAVAKSSMERTSGSATAAQDITRNSGSSDSASASSVADRLGMVGVARKNTAEVTSRPQGSVDAVNKPSSANNFVNTTNSTSSPDSVFSDDDRVPLDVYDSFAPSQIDQSHGSNSFHTVATQSNATGAPLTQSNAVTPPWEDDNPSAAPTASSLRAAGTLTAEVTPSSRAAQDQSLTGGLSETEEIKNILTASFGEGIKFEKVDD